MWNSTHSTVTLHIFSGVIKMDKNFSAAFSIRKDHSNYLSNLSNSISRWSIKNIMTFVWAFSGFWTSIRMSRYYTDVQSGWTVSLAVRFRCNWRGEFCWKIILTHRWCRSASGLDQSDQEIYYGRPPGMVSVSLTFTLVLDQHYKRVTANWQITGLFTWLVF